MTEVSYPVSKVRGDAKEELPLIRPGTAAERSYPMSKVRGSAQNQGQGPGGATPSPRPGVAAGRSNPTSKK